MAKVKKIYVSSSYKLSQDYHSLGDELGYEIELEPKDNVEDVQDEYFVKISRYLRKRSKVKAKRGIVKTILGVKDDSGDF